MVSTQSPLVTDNPNKASQCHSFTLVPDRSRSKDIILQKGKIFIHLHFPIDCLTHLYYFPSDETNSFLNPRYFRTEPKSGTTNHLPTSIWSQMKFLLNEIFVSTNNKSVDYFKLIWKMTISYFFIFLFLYLSSAWLGYITRKHSAGWSLFLTRIKVSQIDYRPIDRSQCIF